MRVRRRRDAPRPQELSTVAAKEVPTNYHRHPKSPEYPKYRVLGVSILQTVVRLLARKPCCLQYLRTGTISKGAPEDPPGHLSTEHAGGLVRLWWSQGTDFFLSLVWVYCMYWYETPKFLKSFEKRLCAYGT